MKLRNLFAVALAMFLSVSPEARAEDPVYGVRLLTHYKKSLTKSGLGVGGWLILPNIAANANNPLFLVGPSYSGKGYWAEAMVGYRVDPSEEGIPGGDIAMVNSNRFQLTPKFFGKPVNVWGNLQFIGLNKDDVIPYLFLMVDYVLPDKRALIGLETENYFNLPGAEGTIDDTAFGPQLVLPFDGLNMIMAYQLHTHDAIPNQVWVRAMYNFGGPK